MNLRHAAALALVGWYLMTPPVNGNWDTDVSVKIEAPRSEWDIFGRCAMSDALAGNIKSIQSQKWSAAVSERVKKDIVFAAQAGDCIATDDPATQRPLNSRLP